MSNVALAKPSSRTGAVIVAADIGTDSTDDFLIKVMQSRLRFRNPIQETTGDGDDDPAFDASNWGYLSFQFTGYMIAASVATFPIANLTNTNNPLAASMKFHLADQQVLAIAKALIETIDIEWSRGAATIGVSMSGVATDTGYSWATT